MVKGYEVNKKQAIACFLSWDNHLTVYLLDEVTHGY